MAGISPFSLNFRLFIYLTPFIPLSFKGEGELYGREASPLFNSLFGYPFLTSG